MFAPTAEVFKQGERLTEIEMCIRDSVKANELPAENRIAPFKESYRYNVLLNKHAEIDAVVDDILNDKNVEHQRMWWISCLLYTSACRYTSF